MTRRYFKNLVRFTFTERQNPTPTRECFSEYMGDRKFIGASQFDRKTNLCALRAFECAGRFITNNKTVLSFKCEPYDDTKEPECANPSLEFAIQSGEGLSSVRVNSHYKAFLSFLGNEELFHDMKSLNMRTILLNLRSNGISQSSVPIPPSFIKLFPSHLLIEK